MQSRIMQMLFSLALRRGRVIIAAVIALSAVMAFFIPGIKISSSQKELLPADHPAQAQYLDFMNEFGLSDSIIVVLEGSPDSLKSSAKYFADEIAKEKKYVRSVFFRSNIDFFIQNAPLFIPLNDLKRGLEALEQNPGIVRKASSTNNLYEVLELMKRGISNPAMPLSPDVQLFALGALRAVFDEWNSWMADPARNSISPLDSLMAPGTETARLVKSEGYLFSKDFNMLFIKVQPRGASDEISYLRPLIGGIRAACMRVYETYPGLKEKVKYSITGMPAHVLTETETVFSDVTRAGSFSIFLVLIILLFGFASIRKTVLSLIPLACGMAITLGVISLSIERLNLISSAFLAVLFGIGIDFGIYFIRRTEEELGNGKSIEESVMAAVVRTGRGVITGGITTGLAFLAISFSDFSGYSELGLTAGTGIIIVLVVTLLMMPALLLNVKIEKRHYETEDDDIAARAPKRRSVLWAIVSVSAAGMCFGVYSLFNIGMDYNALSLLPKDTESTVYQMKMEESSDMKMSFAAVRAESLQEVRQISEALEKLTVVARVESAAQLVPPDQKEKQAIIKKYSAYLRNFQIPHTAGEYSGRDYKAVFEELMPFFQNALEDAFAGGRSDLVTTLDALIVSMEKVRSALAGDNSSAALGRTRDFEKTLFRDLQRGSELLGKWMSLNEITEEDVPPDMISQLKSEKGEYALLVYPRESIWDVSALDRFVAEVKARVPNITGFPVTHRVFVRQAASAVFQAMIYAVLMVLLILAVDLRSVRSMLLALIPLVTGMLWMQSLMYILNISYNVANIAALPLLLGLGVVYGVHIVHRWRESPEHSAFVSSHTDGRAVAFAALTTVSGLGSIVFARHQGVSTFGVLLFFGIMLSMISSLYVLPSVIDLLFLRNGREGQGED